MRKLKPPRRCRLGFLLEPHQDGFRAAQGCRGAHLGGQSIQDDVMHDVAWNGDLGLIRDRKTRAFRERTLNTMDRVLLVRHCEFEHITLRTIAAHRLARCS